MLGRWYTEQMHHVAMLRELQHMLGRWYTEQMHHVAMLRELQHMLGRWYTEPTFVCSGESLLHIRDTTPAPEYIRLSVAGSPCCRWTP